MRRKFPILMAASAILASSVLSGCKLMPVEEARPAIPIVNEYQGAQYTEVPVLRGDLTLTKELTCEYTATTSISHAFSEDFLDVKIAAVYVTEGQTVTKGTLIAELNNESIRKQIADQQEKIDNQELKIIHLKEDRDLDLQLQDALIAQYRSQLAQVQTLMRQLAEWEAQENPTDPRPTPNTMAKLESQASTLQKNLEKQVDNRETVAENYVIRIANAGDALTTLQQRMEELHQNLISRQLFAQMDGVVTHADTVLEHPKVKKRATVIVTDMSSVHFWVKNAQDASYLSEGMETEVIVGTKTYTAVVTEKRPVKEDSEDKTAIMKPDAQAIADLQVGDGGTITLILDSRKDTLYVDSTTIQSGIDGSFVYVLGESGLKVKQPVTVGLKNETYAEITEGLEEGDLVIKD